MALAPDYAVSGRFYVYYTAQTAGQLTIAEYQRSANPDVANPASARTVLSISHPLSNHNGGQLQFGPDGYLYIGTGDGGWGGDPDDNAQDLGTLLGKIRRINPVGSPYTIPADNPFVDRPGCATTTAAASGSPAAASQSPRFGARRARGARVHLTLSRGRR